MSNQGRLILCCDGTWSDTDGVFVPSSWAPHRPRARSSAPTNVTRIIGALSQTGLDGKQQRTDYISCVGTGSNIVDIITDAMFRGGIIGPIRAAYNNILARYRPGDEIVLIGTSKGAFTARCVAGMIHNGNLTRVSNPDGSRICVQAVAVWDTVGPLGIPHITAFAKLGLDYLKDYRFHNTDLDVNTKHAFQALALDERRAPFSPAVWERKNGIRSTDLRQVWFPGTHKNVAGVCDDKELSNVTLTWMMDQLASIGVGFRDGCVDRIFQENALYYQNTHENAPITKKQWAIKSLYDQTKPVRPFGLGKIYETYKRLHHFAGKAVRTPGLYHRVDPVTSAPTRFELVGTNERIHSSVRMRMHVEALGPNDHGLYRCPALTKRGVWHLRRMEIYDDDPVPLNASWEPEGAPKIPINYLRWVWFYRGPEKTAPELKVMIEDNLGPYQRQLFRVSEQKESLLLAPLLWDGVTRTED